MSRAALYAVLRALAIVLLLPACVADAGVGGGEGEAGAGGKADTVAEGWGIWNPYAADNRGRLASVAGWSADPETGVIVTPDRRDQEGAQLGTTWAYGAFHLDLEFRFSPDDPACNPLDAEGQPRLPPLLEHFGNSGIYIYDVYEIQLVDSNRAAAPGEQFETRDGVALPVAPMDEVVLDHPRSSGVGQVACGYPYAREPLDGLDYRNHTVATDGTSWNRIQVWFYPPRFEGSEKVQSARLKIDLNGAITTRNVDGDFFELSAGTGSGAEREAQLARRYPLAGRVFLQSHWGSRVEFRNAQIQVL